MIDKNEIIQDLLIVYTKELGKKYSKYFEINDIEEVNNEMRLYLDKTKERKDYIYDSGYIYFLNKFEEKCKELINKLSQTISDNIIIDVEFFTLDYRRKTYYESCCIGFRIKGE